MKERPLLVGALLAMGAGWGITQPLTKIAVSQGYRHFGLIFWQLVIGTLVMGAIVLMRGRGLPLTRPAMARYIAIALVGTILPNSVGYEVARHLPSGLLSIMLSLVPMIAFPIALLMGNDRFSPSRMFGLLLGFVGVMLIALPQGSLPDRGMVAWLPLALLAPLFYAIEGNIVARWGLGGADPFQLLLGASGVGMLIALPLALGSGQWIDPRLPWHGPDNALIASSVLHVFAYTVYVWMVGRAGAIFAVQVSYLATGFGVVWAMLLLGESYSGWIWAALVVLVGGVMLVQPAPPLPSAFDLGRKPDKQAQ